MGAYGSPELHPKLRDNSPPPKKKCPAIFKRISFWLCFLWLVCDFFVNGIGINTLSTVLVCSLAVFVGEGISLLYNAVRGRNARANAIAVICSIIVFFATGIYLNAYT